jgi:hypothetical protein
MEPLEQQAKVVMVVMQSPSTTSCMRPLSVAEPQLLYTLVQVVAVAEQLLAQQV